MVPAFLDRRVRTTHLAAVADCAGSDSAGGDDPGHLGVQIAQETQVGGAGGE